MSNLIEMLRSSMIVVIVDTSKCCNLSSLSGSEIEVHSKIIIK